MCETAWKKGHFKGRLGSIIETLVKVQENSQKLWLHSQTSTRVSTKVISLKLNWIFVQTLSNEYLSYENFNYKIKKGGAHAS